MFSTTTLSVLFGAFLVITTIPDAASFSKYGRNCNDIGCLSDEVCVMAEDACTGYSNEKCGRYPKCQKANARETGCTSVVCGTNEYCKSVNGVATCVSKLSAPVPPYRRPNGYRPLPPTPPPRTSSLGGGGRYSGSSGSRNSVGDGSIFNRLFGGDRGVRVQTTTPRSQRGGNGYYNTHTSFDSRGNRVWTFSG